MSSNPSQTVPGGSDGSADPDRPKKQTGTLCLLSYDPKAMILGSVLNDGQPVLKKQTLESEELMVLDFDPLYSIKRTCRVSDACFLTIKLAYQLSHSLQTANPFLGVLLRYTPVSNPGQIGKDLTNLMATDTWRSMHIIFMDPTLRLAVWSFPVSYFRRPFGG